MAPPEDPPRRLPLPLRAWARAGRAAPPGLRRRVTGRLARRSVEPGVLYENGLGQRLAVDPADLFQPMMVAGTFDPVVQRLIADHVRRGSVVLEAGGHIGFFTVLLSRAVGPTGRVEVFEPEPRLRASLERHVEANGLSNVNVVPLALSDSAGGTATFHLTHQAGWGSLRAGIWEETETVEVGLTTIDAHVERVGIDPARIGFVKLDVEGVEPEALRGAERTLRAAPAAAVLVEFIPTRIRALGGDPDDLVRRMSDCGYEPWVPTGRSGRLRRGTDPGVGEDVLFLPRPPG